MEDLLNLFSYSFIRNGMAAAFLTSLICGIIGTYVVSKRIVFISGGITHASFGGIGVGYYFGFSPILGAGIFAVLSGLGIEFLSKKSEIRQDSAIGILWSFGMALGIIFVFLTPGYAPNLMSYLFGNILTVGTADLIALIALSIIIVAFFTIFFNIILYSAFDPEYAKTYKLPTNLFDYIIAALISLTIVVSIRVVGIVLVISLLTIPQTTANLFTHNFRNMMILSVIIGFAGSMIGLLLAYLFDIPSGASIIFTLSVLFAVIKLFLLVKRKTNKL